MKTLFLLLSLTLSSLGLDVASLHPLMTDLVKQVGGDRVNIVQIGKPGMNVHHFEPLPADVKKLGQVKLIFASGKGLEPYLDSLRDSLTAEQLIVEVGETIPSQKVSAEDEIYSCCPSHSHGGIDPHWWHNVRYMERAARVIEKALIKADPDGKETYAANSKTTVASLRQLDRWVKGQIALIPEENRRLVTSHAAFGYFCKAYGMKASYVQGLSAHAEVATDALAHSIHTLQDEAIPVVFPEVASNPKILQQISRQSGAAMGEPLIADGSVASYQKMITDNVTRIVSGLTQ